jgi:gentisate 1,2-dioxygenase
VRFDWSAGDMFVLPSWATHEHVNGSDKDRAILFAVHDTPLMHSVDKYRIEPAPEPHQVISESFSASA